MTNEFKILWFEDETTWYTMQSKKVANHLKNTYNLKTTPKFAEYFKIKGNAEILSKVEMSKLSEILELNKH